jgi:hypothetical protein
LEKPCQDYKNNKTMQHYIKQLIEDLHRATRDLQPPHGPWKVPEAGPASELELKDMAYVEKYIYGEKEPIAQITGIGQEQLPAPEKLDKEQQALLATELENFMQYFYFRLDFPANYPPHLRYPFIRKFWGEEHVVLSFGENHIEFCDYEDEACPFPGYCSICKEVSAEMRYDKGHSSKTDVEVDVNELLWSPAQIETWMKQQEDNEGEATEQEQLPFGIDKNEGPFTEEINGFYDDNGNKIDFNLIRLPGLCIVCKEYEDDDWEENLLCQMNRYGQRNKTEFICGDFKQR